MTTWTPKTAPAQSWTIEVFPTRVFDPAVFDNAPIFDTGSPAGVWAIKVSPNQTWATEATP